MNKLKNMWQTFKGLSLLAQVAVGSLVLGLIALIFVFVILGYNDYYSPQPNKDGTITQVVPTEYDDKVYLQTDGPETITIISKSRDIEVKDETGLKDTLTCAMTIEHDTLHRHTQFNRLFMRSLGTINGRPVEVKEKNSKVVYFYSKRSGI